AAPPQQNELAAPLPALERGGYRIAPLQSFSLEARVLASERYRFGREADLSPIDLALGWGAMSDSAVLADFDITQSGRFYLLARAAFSDSQTRDRDAQRQHAHDRGDARSR